MAALRETRGRVALAGWFLLAPLAGTAWADDLAALTLRDALDRALAQHPALAVGREDVSAAEARVRQSEFGPAPEIGVELENFAGSGDLEGTDALETTLQISRALELGGKRTRAVEVARAERDSALAALDLARLDVAAETARRFVDVLGAQAQLETAGRFLDLARTIRSEAERRVTAGNALSAELYRARAEVGREELFGARAQADLDVARRALAASWGEPRAASPPAAGELFTAPEIEPLAALLERIEQSPRLAGLATAERLRAAELRLAEAQSRPDIDWSLGLRHLAEPDDVGLVAGISIPFAGAARSRARTAEAEALLRQSQAARSVEHGRVVAAITTLHRQIELRLQTLRVLERDVLPATAAALEQIDRGYRLGRLPYGEYALAAREALDTEIERVRIATEYHQLLAELEALTGAAVRSASGS